MLLPSACTISRPMARPRPELCATSPPEKGWYSRAASSLGMPGPLLQALASGARLPGGNIPTSNTTAILLGTFQNHGIQPGPQLFTTSSSLVWDLIAALYMLVLNLPLVGLRVKLLKILKP